MTNIIQPMPRENFNVSYICRYESEIDRQIILDSMGHYIEAVLGTRDIIFVKLPMEAVNKVFNVSDSFSGEEIEFIIDYKHNNVIPNKVLTGDQLAPLWAVMVQDESDVKLIQTIEPCKFIIKNSDFDALKQIMHGVELAPKEYNTDALNKVHWNERTRVLRQDFEFFTSSRRWFVTKGIPYNRSYILYGPPGNGKTTTIKSFAKYLNVAPEVFDFTAQSNSPDKTFTAWVLGDSERIARDEAEDEVAARKYMDEEENDEEEGPTPLRLLVLEDIDRFYPNGEPPQTAVSLSCVLNSLDGAIERRNTIVIATANHPENLDEQVLARPGRFDKRVQYEHPNIDHAINFLLRLFDGEDVTEDAVKLAAERLQGHSYAVHKELFTSAGSSAYARSSKLICDEDVKNALDDIFINTNISVMKSERRGPGFK